MFINISPIFFYQCREPSPVSLVSCLLPVVSCLFSPVSLVSGFLFPSPIVLFSVSRLRSHVSHAVSAADLIYDLTDLTDNGN